MRVVVSLLDFYRKTKRRLRALEQGWQDSALEDGSFGHARASWTGECSPMLARHGRDRAGIEEWRLQAAPNRMICQPAV